MPLQAIPPHRITANKTQRLTSREVLQERRRTLQTVSELSQVPSSPEPSSTTVPTGTSNHASKRYSVGHTLTGRKNRPQSGSLERSIQRQPTILITEADTPSLQLASTALPDNQTGHLQRENDQAQNSSKSNRLSVRFSLRKSPKDGQESSSNSYEAARSASGRIAQKSGQNPGNERIPTAQMSVRVQDATGRSVPYGDGVRGGRDSEKIRREQAVTEAKARREKQGGGISMGSSSTLPSMSPPPIQVPNSVQPRGRTSQQQLLRNSRTMDGSRPTGQVHRQISQPQIDRHLDNNDINARLLKRASAHGNGALTAYRDPILRPQSTSSNVTTASRILTQNNPMPFSSTQSPMSYSFPRPPSEALLQERTSRSGYPSQRSRVRSSSTHSAVTANTSVSNGTNGSRKSSPAPRYRRSSNSRRHQNGITKEHLDALAALTAPSPTPDGRTTPESAAFLQSHQRKLDEKVRRASVASERATRISQSQENRRSRSGSRVSQHSRGTDASKSYRISINEVMKGGNGVNSGRLEGLTPESVRLLREREKLLRWKAEREKVEFEKREREKIRERVKRANEMEEARSKDLAKAQKKRRGCCGLFGG